MNMFVSILSLSIGSRALCCISQNRSQLSTTASSLTHQIADLSPSVAAVVLSGVFQGQFTSSSPHQASPMGWLLIMTFYL
ncbi:uncharacterized protein BO72DRAFT_129234 [Aspergillus fijiensis CBS 313.89]|uniref:Secreted protein n=1 Tax=Aspergillus fijiensis CBS 313.89 TaxID=1448319 RepID=A0A8G1VYP0_9EURO|nr:uncharacterized protein BO72DRAFT_129234 [Aspergillus fijiensis CBS 313.89]RAK76501.1 hypothetical protein BO72DRAFT_129234 [Aspergillus fijiensis CBS 313.89]